LLVNILNFTVGNRAAEKFWNIADDVYYERNISIEKIFAKLPEKLEECFDDYGKLNNGNFSEKITVFRLFFMKIFAFFLCSLSANSNCIHISFAKVKRFIRRNGHGFEFIKINIIIMFFFKFLDFFLYFFEFVYFFLLLKFLKFLIFFKIFLIIRNHKKTKRFSL